MAVFDTNLDYTKLIQFTDGTLQIASFVQIRNALIQRFKDIYGNDIDVSPASADGQYVNSISLLINNILQTIKKGYDSLDPAVATGQYLDTLCSYNNISRIMPTASTAQLYIYNSTSDPITVNYLTFIDKNNILWVWDNGGVNKTFASKTYTLLTNVVCSELGAISAPGTSMFYYYDNNGLLVETQDPSKQSWSDSRLYGNMLINGTIYQTIENNGLWVWQYSDAEEGEDEETDEALRSRRYMMLGNASVSVLEGLRGNLLNITGIKDVYIFNNASSSSATLTSANGYEPVADNTVVDQHSVYIALRYKEGVNIPNESIARIIYNKLTPGILTTETYNSGGDEDMYYNIPRTEQITDVIYWKKCSSIHPYIQLKLYCKPEIYDYPVDSLNQVIETAHPATSSIEEIIVNNLQEFISECKINDYLTVGNMMTTVQQSDIQKSGMSTFFTQTGFINTSGTYKWPANLSYFKYNNKDVLFSYNAAHTECTIDIAGTTGLFLELNATELTLAVGDTFTLTGQVLPTTATTGSLTFSSSASGKASVNSSTGKITAVSAGTATITVTDGTLTSTCVVTVE